MNNGGTLFGRAPSLYLAVISGAISLLVAFGFDWNGEQVALLNAFAAAVIFLITNTTTTPIADPTLRAGTSVKVTDGNGTKIKHNLPTIRQKNGIVTVDPAPIPDTVVKSDRPTQINTPGQ